MTSGTLIREARMRAASPRCELSERSGKDRAQLARWERDVVQPSLETLREVLHACGFDLEPALVPYEADEQDDARLREELLRIAAGAAAGDAEKRAAADGEQRRFDPYATAAGARAASGHLRRDRRARAG